MAGWQRGPNGDGNVMCRMTWAVPPGGTITLRWLGPVAAASPIWPCWLATMIRGEPVSRQARWETLLNSTGTKAWFIPAAPSPRPSQTS